MTSSDQDRSLGEPAVAAAGDRPVPDWVKDLREGRLPASVRGRGPDDGRDAQPLLRGL